MLAGANKKQKYIPVHEVFQNLPEGSKRAYCSFTL